MADALHIEDLTVAYGARPVIQGLTLPPIEPGTVTALVGPNGAGKSTVLKAVAQIISSRGTLRLGASNLRQLPARERAALMGFMPQGLPLAVELTAIESLIVALQASGSRSGVERRALEVLQRVDIAALALRPLERLSGGERQLVSLAQAVARSPRLLFLDEPTSALDLARQHEVMRLVRSFAREGTTVVMVLHDLSLAAHWADRMIVLDRGRLHSAGPSSTILTSKMLRDVYGLAAQVDTLAGRLFVVQEDLETLGQAAVPRMKE